MKTVQGVYRQYQLVDKTKKKDLDGVVYLVAGERSLWVKLLKDRSAEKREEIIGLISRGASSGFEKPLEIVNDSKGFAGYTFRGPEMEIVPEKTVPDKTKKTKKKENPGFGGPTNNQLGNFSGGFNPPPLNNSTGKNFGSAMSKAQQFLILGITGAVMFALTLLLDNWLVQMIYTGVSQTAGEGCGLLSFSGILPAVVGVVLLILYQRAFGWKMNSIPVYIVFAVLAFLCGVAGAYAIIGVLCVLVISIFGVVKAYQSVIVTVIVLIILAKALIPRNK